MPGQTVDRLVIELEGQRYRIVPLSFAALTAGTLIYNRGAVLVGTAFEETTGTATARVELIDGGDANGELVYAVRLAANESARDWPPSPRLACQFGIYVHVTAGSVAGVLHVGLPVT